MSLRLTFGGGGSYDVQASEACRKEKPCRSLVRCVVKFLDETEDSFEVDKHEKAQELLEKVFDHLELVEKDYFGLQYYDAYDSADGMRWLDPSKSIKRQLKSHPPYLFYFRVKFYVSDPTKLLEEYTRYHLYLQLKQDICEGRLYCNRSTAVKLASYAVQSELGDYSAVEHPAGYLSGYRFVPNQDADFVDEVAVAHGEHVGQTPADAERNFLHVVKQLEMYGVDLYPARVRDENNLDVQLGVGGSGISIFQNGSRLNTFPWLKIVKISFKRRIFCIQLQAEKDDVVNVLVFKLNSSRGSKDLWRSCVEQHTFFRRLHALRPPASNRFFSFGVKGDPWDKLQFDLDLHSNKDFRLYETEKSLGPVGGRTEYQSVEEAKRRARVERSFARTPSKKITRRTISSSDPFREKGFGPSAPTGAKTTGVVATVPVTTIGRAPNGVTGAVAGMTPAAANTTSTVAPTPANGDLARNRDPRLRNRFAWQRAAKQAPTAPSEVSVATARSEATTDDGGFLSRMKQRDRDIARTFGGPAQPTVLPSSQSQPVSVVNAMAAVGSSVGHANPPVVNQSSEDTESNRTLDYLANVDELEEFDQLVVSSSGDSGAVEASPKLHTYVNNHRSSNQAGGRFPSTTAANDVNVVTVTSSAAVPAAKTGPFPYSNANTSSNINGDTPKTGLPVTVPAAGHEGLVTIRIKADNDGKFGFNVKGGCDQRQALVVTKVAAGSPADLAIPKLNEGDQILFINGRDASQMEHDEVVTYIRSCREQCRRGVGSRELILVVEPRSLDDEILSIETAESQDYLPDSDQVDDFVAAVPINGSKTVQLKPAIANLKLLPNGTSSSGSRLSKNGNVHTSVDPLKESIQRLHEDLSTGIETSRFEKLARRKAGMLMQLARLSQNATKNRYRDISPYDETRVVLKTNGPSDYINASFVNMEIPGSGILNRYIAAQGPLSNTCADFWLMCWEQQSSLIVMLTATTEQQRVKCCQYWPNLFETHEYQHDGGGCHRVTCVKEVANPAFTVREMSIVDTRTGEERHVCHFQYVAWPDHGVPEDSTAFLDFVFRVRQYRIGMVEPMIVHCSAGIGRTGVLILMETAMCLIEANQPVYPLEITREMRSQRAMLIQTTSQYRFVCDAIVRVYEDAIVRPLDDFKTGPAKR